MKTKAVTLDFSGKRYSGDIHRMTYLDGGAALRMMDGEGCVATLSVSVVGYMPATVNHVVIKDYSENAGVFDQLVSQGIIRGTGERVQTGWVTSPVAEIMSPELRE